MKIQLITNEALNFDGIVVSPLGSPRSLDEFEINVIDLSSSNLWRCESPNVMQIDAQNDLYSIRTMVEKRSTSKIIYIFPQNTTFYYDCHRNNGQTRYIKRFLLKDRMGVVEDGVITKALPRTKWPFSLVYENTRTSIAGRKYEADFYFEHVRHTLTKSDLSNKVTTIKIAENEIYATTLKVSNSKEELLHFLSFLFDGGKKEAAPSWISEINFGDDLEQKEIIEKSAAEIKAAEQKITDANARLDINSEYKSILYTNGDELVRVVFKILEQLFNCDLSGFVDEKREDFLIKKETCTFIGEIKGVTSNIRSEHISQVDVHYQGYMDRLQEENRSENVRQLLIMNPFRNRAPIEREPVHEQQVALANRNGCLIIETTTLLHVFERFLKDDISSEECISVFSSHIGLLKESDFDL